MADIDLKTATPDTSLPTTGFLFGADSQSAASPSVYSAQTVATTLLGSTSLTGATITADAPVLNMAQTWNNAAVTFTGLKFNVTDTASASGSLLMDLQVGGSSMLQLNKSGRLYFGSGNGGIVVNKPSGIALSLGGTDYTSFSRLLVDISGSTASLCVSNTSSIQWGSGTYASSSGNDLFLTRRAAANLRFGAADAAAPVAQTLSVQSVVAGTTNTAGANLTITGSQGTGTGAGGSIVFQVAPAGSTGSAQNALADALIIPAASAGGSGTGARPIVLNGGTTSTSPVLYPGNGGSLTVGRYDDSTPRAAMGIVTSAARTGFVTLSDGVFAFSSSGVNLSTADTILARDAANTLALRNGTNAQTFRVYNTTDGTNSEFGKIAWSSNVLQIGTEKAGTGTARALEFQTDGTTRLTIAATGAVTFAGGINLGGSINLNGSTEATRRLVFNGVGFIKWPSDGIMLLQNDAQTDFGRLQFGGTTSSFPALKRSSTTLQVRLADDSAFASVQGKLTTDTAYAAGDPTTTGYLVVYDSTGTAYKIPAVAV